MWRKIGVVRMNKQDAIEMLKSMLPEKISYAELIGASSCYGDGGLVYADPEPYAIETAISALEQQIPKKPEFYGDSEDGKLLCPSCGEDLWDIKECGFNGCPYCLQAIDWGNEDE